MLGNTKHESAPRSGWYLLPCFTTDAKRLRYDRRIISADTSGTKHRLSTSLLSLPQASTRTSRNFPLSADIMRSNPTAAWDKNQANKNHLATSQALRFAPSSQVVSKRNAKHDHRSLNKGRAWRMKGTSFVPASRTKLSRIDWA